MLKLKIIIIDIVYNGTVKYHGQGPDTIDTGETHIVFKYKNR